MAKLFNCWATLGQMRVNFCPKLFNCWPTVGQKRPAFWGKSGSPLLEVVYLLGNCWFQSGFESTHVNAKVAQLLFNFLGTWVSFCPSSCLTVGQLVVSIGVRRMRMSMQQLPNCCLTSRFEAAHVKAKMEQPLFNSCLTLALEDSTGNSIVSLKIIDFLKKNLAMSRLQAEIIEGRLESLGTRRFHRTFNYFMKNHWFSIEKPDNVKTWSRNH